MTEKPKNLAEALAAFQAKLPQVAKGETAVVPTKTGGSYKYSYADLADVSKVVLPLLGPLGLSWVTRPTLTEGGKFVLAYELLHASGESRTGEYPLQLGTPQEMGSAITYARRYALLSVTGVAPEQDDDDGASASRPQRDDWEAAKPANDEQVALFESLMQRINTANELDEIPPIGRDAATAKAQGRITPAQYNALDLKAGKRIAELKAEEQS